MITTKRQIRTNDDRYIGSADDEMRMNASVTDDIRSDFADIRMTDDAVRETHEAYDLPFAPAVKMPVIEQKQPIEEKPLYTTRETLKTELPPRPVKQKAPRDAEDVMPSLKTLSTAESRAEVAPAEKAVSFARPTARTNLSPKMKVVLFVCLAVALVLAIAVIATGVSISHASAESVALDREISAKRAVIAEQQATIADLTSDSTLRDEALRNGMVSAGEPAYTASRAEKSDYPDAVPHTNGFDSFCDWLGNIIN